MADFRISDLSPASVLHESDLLETSQPDVNSASGYQSMRITDLALATFILKSINFADLSTTAKNVIGSINEVYNVASTIPTFAVVVVQSLPVSDISTTTIYMVPSSDPTQTNAYDEYIYVNNAWEFVGSTQVDLSNYYTKSQTDTLLNGKVDSVPGKGLSTNDFVNTGDYPAVTVGESNTLTMRKMTQLGTDSDVFMFRPFPAAASGASLQTIEIVGGSVVWNQLSTVATDYAVYKGTKSTDGDTIIASYDNSTNVNMQIYKNVSIPANHKVLLSGKFYPTKAVQVKYTLSGGNYSTADISITANVWNTLNFIANPTANVTQMVFYTNRNTVLEEGDYVKAKDFQIIDLTQMFGSTIANYIYTLEQSTAGSGVAWFRKYFPNVYYAYSAPTIQSTKVSGKKVVGFNAYNNTTGKAKLLGGNLYQITGTYTALSYSTGETITPDSNGKFTPTNNGELTVTGGNATDTCVHLVWDGERDGEYEPYKSTTYDLSGSHLVTRNYEYRAYTSGDESLPDTITDGTNTVTKRTTPITETVTNPTLYGIWKLDANNNLYFDGDSIEDITLPEIVEPYGTEQFTDAEVAAGNRDVSIPVQQDTTYYTAVESTMSLPETPVNDGDYTLKLNVNSGVLTFSWESTS